MILLKRLKYYLKQKKYLVLFISILALSGAIAGLYLGITNIEFLKEDVLYYTSHINNQSYNYILFHFFAVVISIVTSFLRRNDCWLFDRNFFSNVRNIRNFICVLFLNHHKISIFYYSSFLILKVLKNSPKNDWKIHI